MSSPHGPVLLVANPRSGDGRGRALRDTVELLAAAGVEHDVVTTRGAGHASDLARAGVQERGFRFVVAVGGDGTVNEVVNGLVDPVAGEARAEELVLGVVASGSGSDFLRTFGLDVPTERMVTRHLLTDALYPLDLGRVRHRGPDGTEQVRLFANIAECGFGADVTRRANRLPRFVGRSRYTLATLASALRLDPVATTVLLDHTERTEAVTEVVVANGQFFGGGMKVAPRALPDDGTFNVQTWRGGTREVLTYLPRMGAGEHLASPTVREWQSAQVDVTTATPMTIEADGEVLGTTPATFDVLPSVLSLSV